jgi:ABC-2 type transport system permease protein
MYKKLFSNSMRLTRFILRRDRLSICIWILAIVTTTLACAYSFADLYPTETGKIALAETMKNPTMTTLIGPGYGLDNYTYGAMLSHMMLLFTIIAVAIMNIFFVIKHTRKDEEYGRLEVVRSLPIGRLANALSTLLASVVINIFLAIITGIGLFALSIESITLSGSLLYGVVLGISGIFFGAVALLFVQILENTKGASGLSFIFLGIFYLIRSYGDISSEMVSIISPLGLILRTQVFVNNKIYPVFILLLLAVVISALAFKLCSIRDMGEGLIAARPGRKYAPHSLLGRFGLTLRLTRTAFIGWLSACFIAGMGFGTGFEDFETFIGDNEYLQTLLGDGAVEYYIAMLISMLVMIVAIPAISIIFKVKNEEKENRIEHLYARNVSKVGTLFEYVIISFIGSILMLLSSTVFSKYLCIFHVYFSSACVK